MPEKLYHFTSVAGLYGIVESGELRPHQIDFYGFVVAGEYVWLTDDEEGGAGWVVRDVHQAGPDTDPQRLHEKDRVCITVDMRKGDFCRAETVTNRVGRGVLWSIHGGRYKKRWWVTNSPIAVADFSTVGLDGVRYASVSMNEDGLYFASFDK